MLFWQIQIKFQNCPKQQLNFPKLSPCGRHILTLVSVEIGMSDRSPELTQTLPPNYILHTLLCYIFHTLLCYILHTLLCYILHTLLCYTLHTLLCYIFHMHTADCYILDDSHCTPLYPQHCTLHFQTALCCNLHNVHSAALGGG